METFHVHYFEAQATVQPLVRPLGTPAQKSVHSTSGNDVREHLLALGLKGTRPHMSAPGALSTLRARKMMFERLHCLWSAFNSQRFSINSMLQPFLEFWF